MYEYYPYIEYIYIKNNLLLQGPIYTINPEYF